MPAPVIIGESLGALALMLGLGTRLAAFGMIAIMLGAIFPDKPGPDCRSSGRHRRLRAGSKILSAPRRRPVPALTKANRFAPLSLVSTNAAWV